MSIRDTVLERVDPLAFFARENIALKHLTGNEYRFLCPFHEDNDPSANVNISSKLWNCHACGKGGSLIDFLMEKHPGPSAYKEALTDLASFVGVSLEKKTNGQAGPATPAPAKHVKLTEENVAAWHAAAKRNPELMRWFFEKRGYTQETVEKWQLGWDGQRVTIPIRDEAGALVNVRRYRDPREKTSAAAGKMIGIASGMNEARLFPWEALSFEEVVLAEGEWDAIILQQYGFPNAMTVTSGAGIFKPEWVPFFDQKRVTILYDNDEAGRRGAQRVAAILSRAAQVSICQIPGLPEKGDVTDFFVEQGRSVEELRSLLDDASPYLLAETSDADVPPLPVRLHEASDARYQRKRLETPVLLSGKATTPYTVPYKYTAKCDLSNKRYCSFCPLNDVGGVRKVVLSPSDPAVLQLVGVTTQQQQAALKVLAKAVPQCNRPVIEVEEAINVEELRIIPELDNGAETGDAEYVTRTGYFLGHGLRTNRSYRMLGYAHPHPKTQGTVHLLNEAIPSQDNVSAFAMTPEIKADLSRCFVGDPATVFGRVYEDFRKTVHRIQDRPDMQVAYDLAWHSPIAFYFNGAFVRRGWVEVMVMGDSGQGKTEMAMALLAHYKMGARVQAEQASTAGLIGGLEKMGDSWMLSWGQVPLNDKRLLVIDETQGLPSQQIESMSDVRATGVAEITKIRTERTNARCRIVWLANPVSGLTLSQHNQGVLAIKDLFKKPEDIRRLDFAITVASGDVRLERVNVLHDEAATEPIHPSDPCRNLVLWAWSRLPHQIEFDPKAVDLILAEATRMGRRYHAAIPLVEPSDQRLKLARLSAACAARCFSSPDGERLVIKPEHVAFVVDFLERIYNAPSMSYGEYSDQQRKGESLSEDESVRVRTQMVRWTNAGVAMDFFRGARIFKKSDLIDVVGWDEAEAKAELRFMASNRLIRPTREGYAKTAAFIALLRQVAGQGAAAGNDEPLPDDGDAPF